MTFTLVCICWHHSGWKAVPWTCAICAVLSSTGQRANSRTVAVESAEATVVKYDWHVRIKRAAPDCFSKEVIVVNGEFQPSITVRQGNILQVRTLL